MIRKIQKTSGTYSDALEAIGWASLMSECGVKRVEIRDLGQCFSVEGEGEMSLTVAPSPGYCFVLDDKNPAPEVASWKLDYAGERAKDEALREFEKALKAGKKKKHLLAQASDTGDIQMPDPPRPELKLAKMIYSMRKRWNADRDLAVWMNDYSDDFREWISAVVNGAPNSKAPDFSNTQLLNPAAGKGVSSAKTQAKSPNSLPSSFLDSFAEWMKLRGLWRGMLAYRGGDDFKFMVLEPGSISPDSLGLIRSELERLPLWGGIRLDIDATLHLTAILIRNSDVAQSGKLVSLKGKSPRSVITGLRQAFFKSLGIAAALMNDALLPLPAWFGVENKGDADAYIRVIDEAIGLAGGRGCLGALDEDKSDEGAVLQLYRAWLMTGDFEDLIEFHHSFGALMLRKAAANDYTRQFSTEILDDLLIRTYEGTHMVTEIIGNRGFQSVARAIRNTTIYAVGLKTKQREIQFGLSQRWRQSIKQGGGKFPVELSEFVQVNNWEVVYRLGGKAHQVTTTDLDQVFQLIETHGEELVGSLLLAYGFSRAPKVQGDDSDAEEQGEQGVLDV